MKKQNICSVLVSSCDKYSDAWNPFFSLFKKFWSNCPYRIYLNTETKSYNDEHITVTSLNCNSHSWGQRLKKSLKRIHSKYVIMLLEDFFFLDYVNQREIERCLDLMDKDKRISVIDFEYDSKSFGELYQNQHNYCIRSIKSMYFLNCQAAIWRRKDLIKYVSIYESPWQFELFGSERVKIYNHIFLLSCKKNNVFNYNVNWTSGYGIHGGKWLKSNIDLFKSHGISVDFSNMGFFTPKDENIECFPPRVSIRFRIEYLFLSGGNIKPRMPISEQIKLLFSNPKDYNSLLRYKIKKCLVKDFFMY